MNKSYLALFSALMLAGCVTIPSGPSIMAMPGTGKSFDQFRIDDMDCKGYASSQVQGAGEAQSDSALKSAAIGTAVGALAGVAIGGNSRGAGVGAGTGLLFGSLAGADAGNRSGYSAQHRYDIAYSQCMYAKGNKVPVNGRLASQSDYGGNSSSYTPPPPPPPSSSPYSAPPPPNH